MRDLLNKIEVWEQRWTKYEMDNNETLSQDLKLGALMKMLPPKEREVVRLKYVENESALSYDVLRRQVEYWLESVSAANGPAPMDLSTLQQNLEKGTLNVEQLEAALDILRKGGGPKGKGGNRGTPTGSTKGGNMGGRTPKGGGRGREERAERTSIKGNCWNCGLPGHTASSCRKPKRADLKSMEEEQREDDGEGSEQSQGMGMLGLGCLDWSMFGVHAPDEVGMCDYIPDDDDESDDESIDYDSDYSGYDSCSDGMSDLERDDDEFLDCIEYPDVGRPLEGDLDLSPFSEINSEESEDGDDEAEEVDSDMIRAIEEQLKSKKAIRKAIDGEQIDPWQESKQMDPWQQPKRPVRGADKIRGIPLTDKYLSLNPFRNLVSSSAEIAQDDDEQPDVLTKHIRRLEACSVSSPSISPIKHSNDSTELRAPPQTCKQFRMDDSLETPPGL